MLKAALIYTAGRILIFAVILAALWALKLGSYPGILFALLLSMPASYFLLGKQREDLVQATAERREKKAALRTRLQAEGGQATSSHREADREQDAE